MSGMILIVDVESTGLDPKTDKLIEIGAVLWHVDTRSIVRVFSGLLPATENAVEHVNGISPSTLAQVDSTDAAEARAMAFHMAERADALVAHNAAFDSSWLPELTCDPWICTQEDLVWPKPAPAKSLTALALAHGCAVVAAHRAINDCLLLARCFEAIPDIGTRLVAAREHARLPKGRVLSLAPFDDKELVKEHGFRWSQPGYPKQWTRWMTIADAEKLPFPTKVIP